MKTLKDYLVNMRLRDFEGLFEGTGQEVFFAYARHLWGKNLEVNRQAAETQLLADLRNLAKAATQDMVDGALDHLLTTALADLEDLLSVEAE